MTTVKLNSRALGAFKWHEYLVRFLLGGAFTAVVGWLSGRIGPVAAGLFLAFPALFPSGASLLEKHQQRRKRAAGIPFTLRGRLAAALEARGAVMGAVGSMAFAALVWQLLPGHGPAVTLALALLLWLGISTLLWYVRKHHPWRRLG